jgi:hypothetical protein
LGENNLILVCAVGDVVGQIVVVDVVVVIF